MRKTVFQYSLFILIFMCPIFSYALTPQQVVELKKTGVNDKTIQMMIEQEEQTKDTYSTMGTKEVKDKDGNTVIIYTTGKSSDSDDKEAKKVENA